MDFKNDFSLKKCFSAFWLPFCIHFCRVNILYAPLIKKGRKKKTLMINKTCRRNVRDINTKIRISISFFTFIFLFREPYIYIYKGNTRCSFSVLLTVIWLLKSLLNLKLSLLIFNLLVILKATSQL